MKKNATEMLRRNINKIMVFIGVLLFIVIIAIQPKQVPQTKATEVSEKPKASINQHFESVLAENGITNTNLNNDFNDGVVGYFIESVEKKLDEADNCEECNVIVLNQATRLAPKIVEAEKSDVENKDNEKKTKPKVQYKSIEEVVISRDMDLTETTGLSKKDFRKLMSKFESDYAGFYEKNADLIWEFSQKYHVNEIFICGVFALESYFGSDQNHIDTHNYGSIMSGSGKLVRYDSDEEGIKANYKLFSKCYLSPKGMYYKGVTIDSIGDTYCPPTPECPSWADRVYCCMQYFLE